VRGVYAPESEPSYVDTGTVPSERSASLDPTALTRSAERGSGDGQSEDCEASDGNGVNARCDSRYASRARDALARVGA